MKSIFVAVVLLVVAFNLAQALTEEQRKTEQEHAVACMKQTGLSAESVKKVQSGDFANADEQTKCFTKCLLEKHGFLNANGELLEQQTIDALSKNADKAKVTALVHKCKTSASSNACENAFQMFACYKKAQVV